MGRPTTTDRLIAEALEHAVYCEQLEAAWRAAVRDIARRSEYALKHASAWARVTGGYMLLSTRYGRGLPAHGMVCGEIVHHPDADPELVAGALDQLRDASASLLASQAYTTGRTTCAHAHRVLVDADGVRQAARLDDLPAVTAPTPGGLAGSDTDDPDQQAAMRSERWDAEHIADGKDATSAANAHDAWQQARQDAAAACWRAWPHLLERARVRWHDLVWRHGHPSLLLTVGPGPSAHPGWFDRPARPARREIAALAGVAKLLDVTHALDGRDVADAAVWHLNPDLDRPQPLSGPDRDPHDLAYDDLQLTHAHYDPAEHPVSLLPDPDQNYQDLIRFCSCGRPHLVESHLIDRPPHLHCGPCQAARMLGLRAFDPDKEATGSPGVGAGWRPVVWFAGLRAIALDPGFGIDQIKEKFGTLRFYAHGHHRATSVLTDWAENVSGSLCEHCGATGSRRGGGWVQTLCDRCAEHTAPARGLVARAHQGPPSRDD